MERPRSRDNANHRELVPLSLDDLDDNFTEGILTGVPQDDSFIILPSKTATADTQAANFHQLIHRLDSNLEPILQQTDGGKYGHRVSSEIELVDLTSEDSAYKLPFTSSLGRAQFSNFLAGNEPLIELSTNQLLSSQTFEKNFCFETDFSKLRRHNFFIRCVRGFTDLESCIPGNSYNFGGCPDDRSRIEELDSPNNETSVRNKINERSFLSPEGGAEVVKKQLRMEPARIEVATTNDMLTFGSFSNTFQAPTRPEPSMSGIGALQPEHSPGLQQEVGHGIGDVQEEGEGECLVCGANAGRHIHYGGQSCYSCKAFFRRAVIDNTYHNFKCATRSCSIDSKSWRSCKWCRFQKCLSSGLKPSWVLEKKERKRRHASKVNFITRAQHSDSGLQLAPATQGNAGIWGYSADELSQLMILANGVHRDLTKNLLNFYGNNPTLFGKVTG